MAVSQILLLLAKKPLSTSEISRQLDLNPSDVSRHMMHLLPARAWSCMMPESNCYSLARA
ncbi:MAG: helix-turn-helix domain-containing protein [Desulfotignum sp.]|nr:helix-turn-helix domain-containing protein [Desulfotignum sp.]